MKAKRRLHHESLERRRLLAADCQPLDIASNDDTAAPLAVLSMAEGEQTHGAIREFADRVSDNAVVPFHVPAFSYGPDLVHEEGGRIFVVDQKPFEFAGGNLFVFQRTDSGELETVAEVEVAFPVERMIVQGDQVLLFSNSFNWFLPAAHPRLQAAETDTASVDIAPTPDAAKTVVVTVNIGPEVEVIEQKLEGVSHQIHHEGDRIVMVSSLGHDVRIAIYPPPPLMGQLTNYEITADGLRRVASIEVPLLGMTSVHENDFYSARTDHDDIVFLQTPDGSAGDADRIDIRPPDEPVQPTSRITRYFLGEEAIREVNTLELGPGFLMHFELSPDGQTAVAVRSQFLGAGPSTSVDLIDLSGDEAELFQTIHLAQFAGHVLVGGPDYVVLRSFADNTLFVIDADQSIDIDAENRIRRVEIPLGLHVQYQTLRVSADRLVLAANRYERPGPLESSQRSADRLTFAPPEIQPHQTILLTISLSRAEIISDTHLPDEITLSHEQLFLIDADEERFGLVVHSTTDAGDVRQRFLYGRLTEDGEFQRDGSIPVGRWFEIDVDADRLIARESDRLLEYDWDHPEDPLITPLGDPDPTIEANNDHYTLNANGQDHLLDVLANDVIHHFDPVAPAKIIELIGAPEGSEIIEGRLIRIPGAALQGADNLRFEYVISNGVEQSSAVVEIAVRSISEEQVRELVEKVRRRAAEDFGVPVDEIEITSVERIFTDPLPIVRPDGADGTVEIDLSPGILVTLTAPGVTALYAASLEGEIIQVFASRQEMLVDLGLRAVDAEGNPLESITAGDNFWLEFTAKDLREFGLGVYAAFFDLIVPTEHLVITGEVEYGPGFIGIPGSSIDEGEIDELGAIGNEIDPPGNARQQILRFAVRAVGAGEITLRPEPSDTRGTETLVRGRETEVPQSRVRYSSLTLNIREAPDGNRLDTDGNGEVTASDALIVINFLGRYGTTALEDLAETIRAARGEGEDLTASDIDAMHRLDTSGNGLISSLDALLVINGLAREDLISDMANAEDDESLVANMNRPIDGLEGNQLF